MMGKKVAGGLGGLKLRMTKATAERMARAPSAQQQGQVVAETTRGRGGSGAGGHVHDGAESVDEARQKRAASVGSAGSKSPTSPLRFAIKGTDGGSEEQARKAAKNELVDVEVKKGGPAESARAPPLMTQSVLGGKAMVVEEPGSIRDEDGDAEADEAADQVGDVPDHHVRAVRRARRGTMG